MRDCWEPEAKQTVEAKTTGLGSCAAHSFIGDRQCITKTRTVFAGAHMRFGSGKESPMGGQKRIGRWLVKKSRLKTIQVLTLLPNPAANGDQFAPIGGDAEPVTTAEEALGDSGPSGTRRKNALSL